MVDFGSERQKCRRILQRIEPWSLAFDKGHALAERMRPCRGSRLLPSQAWRRPAHHSRHLHWRPQAAACRGSRLLPSQAWRRPAHHSRHLHWRPQAAACRGDTTVR